MRRTAGKLGNWWALVTGRPTKRRLRRCWPSEPLRETGDHGPEGKQADVFRAQHVRVDDAERTVCADRPVRDVESAVPRGVEEAHTAGRNFPDARAHGSLGGLAGAGA